MNDNQEQIEYYTKLLQNINIIQPILTQQLLAQHIAARTNLPPTQTPVATNYPITPPQVNRTPVVANVPIAQPQVIPTVNQTPVATNYPITSPQVNRIPDVANVPTINLVDIPKNTLTDQQDAAASCIHTNSIIIACPGSGKTHTLIAKVHNLIRNGVLPEKIILITFTKKAAEEMQYRLGRKLLHVGTIHSMAYRILQKYDEVNYTVMDETQSTELLEQTAEQRLHTYSAEDALMIRRKIPIIYDKQTSCYPTPLCDIIAEEHMTEYADLIAQVLHDYDLAKQKTNCLDYNNLMINFYYFLQSPTSEKFRSTYSHILFDEYQDVNSIQDMILQELNRTCQNLTVVGDDAQAIYAFRGSEIKYILNFAKTTNNTHTFHLDKNFRSTPEIVEFCNSVISANNAQIPKKMIAVNPSINIKPKITVFKRRTEEVVYVVMEILKNVAAGVKLSDQMIVARVNKQLDNFELCLIRNKIHYSKSKGARLLDRVHVKDFLAFINVLNDTTDEISWKRILAFYGTTNLLTKKIMADPFNILQDLSLIALTKKQETKYSVLSTLIKQLIVYNDNNNIKGITSAITKFMKPYLEKSEELGDIECISSYITECTSISEFLTTIIIDESDNCLLLSTCHGSKGLERDYVYYIGCSSTYAPLCSSALYTKELDNVEEERRLFYVGCSRAKLHLEITHSSEASWTTPFLSSIPPALYDVVGELNFAKLIKSGNVTDIVANYLLVKSSSRVYSWIKSIPMKHQILYQPVINTDVISFNAELAYGLFIDCLAAKQVAQKFNTKLELPVYRTLVKDTQYNNYTDPRSDWRDIIPDILHVALKRTTYNLHTTSLTTPKQFHLYENMSKQLNKLITESLKLSKGKDKQLDEIQLHFNISFGEILGEADIVVGRTLIEIKASKHCTATTKHLLQTLLYRYMLRAKGVRIDRIILFNPILGELYELTTNGWTNNGDVWNELVG